MRVRLTLVVVLLLAGVVAAGGWGWAERRQLREGDFTRQRLTFLEAENRRLGASLDALRDAQDLAATSARRAEIERTVSRLRQLPFLRPVRYRQIPRSQLPDILRQKLAQQVPEQEFGNMGLALVALGLLPHGFDLQKTYFALLGEQIGAFYDQHSKELFTFRGQSLDNAQNRVILAHELTHALEDQHFDLSRLPLETRGNDDRALAASALVEGDATLVMNQYMLGDLSMSALRDSLAGALTTDVRQLAAAPRYLRETLLFPYLHGLEFCQVLYDEGGWGALADAFAHPPASTAEILHPERYLVTKRQVPVEILFPSTEVLGRRPILDNVLGEFGARQLLTAWLKDDQAADQATSGWRGDRALVYGDAAATSYVWRSCWADEPSAARFFDALTRTLSARYHAPMATARNNGERAVTAAVPSVVGQARSTLLLRPAPTEVLLIDAQDERWMTALRQLTSTNKVTP